MRNYPSPCEKCTAKICQGTRCEPWKIRYLYRQKQINAYARKIGVMSEKEGKEHGKL